MPRYSAEGASAIALSTGHVESSRAKPADRPDDRPEALLSLFPQLPSSSALFLRLSIRGEEGGVLLGSAEGPDRYPSQHAALIEAAREPFAIAMLTARRFRDRARLKDLLSEDTRALSAERRRAE